MTLRELAARWHALADCRASCLSLAKLATAIADEHDALRAELDALKAPADNTCECGKPITRPGALYCSGTCAMSGPSGMIKRDPSRQCIATKGHDGGHLFAATDCVANPEERGERCPATQESARESEPAAEELPEDIAIYLGRRGLVVISTEWMRDLSRRANGRDTEAARAIAEAVAELRSALSPLRPDTSTAGSIKRALAALEKVHSGG